MLEIELKFQLPLAQQQPIIQAIGNPQPIPLRAQYFDSATRQLAQQHMALRLRLEGKNWVQTFKAKGKNSLERIESDVAIGQRKTAPKLNLGLYADQPHIQQLLNTALGSDTPLQLQFETDVQRYVQTLTFQDARIEISVDVGEIRSQGRTLALSEVEFELKQGSAEQLLTFAQQWITQFALWLDVRSKAERGHLLSLGLEASAPVKAKAVRLSTKMPIDAALKQLMAAQLEYVLPNLAVVADGIDAVQHRHQLRMALRQLHSLLKSFAQLSSNIPKHWLPQVRLLLSVLGQARDADVFEQDILLQLQCVVPNLQVTVPERANLNLLSQELSCPETQILLLQMLAFTYLDTDPSKAVKLSKTMLPPLHKLYKRICKQAKKFSHLPSGEQHRLRKQIKRLRYSINAIGSILDNPEWAELLQQLQAAQQHIGHYHDLEMALEFAKNLKPQSAREQALDYLHTQQVDAQKRANKALKHLLKSKAPF